MRTAILVAGVTIAYALNKDLINNSAVPIGILSTVFSILDIMEFSHKMDKK